jgi:hypothetical protein
MREPGRKNVPDEGPTSTALVSTETTQEPPLHGEEAQFRARWTEIQSAFVDEPRRAVRDADELVAETLTRLGEKFAQQRSEIEEQWARQNEVSTEQLRVVFQRYRSFFDRLLGVQA